MTVAASGAIGVDDGLTDGLGERRRETGGRGGQEERNCQSYVEWAGHSDRRLQGYVVARIATP